MVSRGSRSSRRAEIKKRVYYDHWCVGESDVSGSSSDEVDAEHEGRAGSNLVDEELGSEAESDEG